MAKISKTWSKAGYAPGQYQKLTITYKSRDGDDVKVHYRLYVKSKGYDYYGYKSRHNKYTLYCPKDKKKKSGTYQAYGSHAVRVEEGNFTVHGVGNTTTSLAFYYKNQRVWPGHTNAWDPRSTGVVSKTKVGDLKIPKNKLHDIVFDEVIKDKTYSYECYHDNKFKIPSIVPTSHFYNFIGWTKTDYLSDWKPVEPVPTEYIYFNGRVAAKGDTFINLVNEDDNTFLFFLNAEYLQDIDLDDMVCVFYKPGIGMTPYEIATVEKDLTEEEIEEILNELNSSEGEDSGGEDSSEEQDVPAEEDTDTHSSEEIIPTSLLEKVNADAKISPGLSITVSSDLDYFAVWRPQTCTYKFYNFVGTSTIDDLDTTYTWRVNEYSDRVGINLPNLYTHSNSKYLSIIPPGYKFLGWECRTDGINNKRTYLINNDGVIPNCAEWPSTSSQDMVVYFYPIITAVKNTIRFYTPNGNMDYDYYTDSIFNMRSPLNDLNKDEITLNPGYKLVGWITIPPSRPPVQIKGFPATGIALPNKAFDIQGLIKLLSQTSIYSSKQVTSNDVTEYMSTNDLRIYPTLGNVVFDYKDFKNNMLQLYPYYEYYTTSYVYVDGEWKLAMPYIYDNNEWKMALSYVYDNGEWKL